MFKEDFVKVVVQICLVFNLILFYVVFFVLFIFDVFVFLLESMNVEVIEWLSDVLVVLFVFQVGYVFMVLDVIFCKIIDDECDEW